MCFLISSRALYTKIIKKNKLNGVKKRKLLKRESKKYKRKIRPTNIAARL